MRRQCRCAELQCGGRGRCYATKHAATATLDSVAKNVQRASASQSKEELWGARGQSDTSVQDLGEEDVVLCPDGLASCKRSQTCAQSVLGPWVCCRTLTQPSVTAALLSHAHECVSSGTQCAPIRPVMPDDVFAAYYWTQLERLKVDDDYSKRSGPRPPHCPQYHTQLQRPIRTCANARWHVAYLSHQWQLGALHDSGPLGLELFAPVHWVEHVKYGRPDGHLRRLLSHTSEQLQHISGESYR